MSVGQRVIRSVSGLPFDFEDLGERRVKNIARLIHVFNVRIEGLAGGMFAEIGANSESAPTEQDN